MNGPGSIRLIDVDCHIGALPDKPVPGTDSAGLQTLMARLGIVGCALTSLTARLHDPASGNADTARLAGTIVGGRPTVMLLPPLPKEPLRLELPDAAEPVAGAAAPGLHGWSLDEPSMDGTWETMLDRRLPLLISSRDAGWRGIDQLAGRWPELNLIVTDIGYRAVREMAPVLDRRPNVHCAMTDFATHLGVEWLVRTFGCTRLLFGTGYPRHDPGSTVARLLWSNLDDIEITAVASGNAIRLMPAFGGERR